MASLRGPSPMLSRAHRMQRSTDLRSTVRSGARAGSTTLVAHVLTGVDAGRASRDADNGHPPQIGFIVNRSVGTAVVRNRVKRRLRHVCRTVVPDLPAGSRVVVRALPPAATTPTTQLANDLESALRRALRKGRRAAGRDRPVSR